MTVLVYIILNDWKPFVWLLNNKPKRLPDVLNCCRPLSE